MKVIISPNGVTVINEGKGFGTKSTTAGRVRVPRVCAPYKTTSRRDQKFCFETTGWWLEFQSLENLYSPDWLGHNSTFIKAKVTLAGPRGGPSGDRVKWRVPATLVFVMGIHSNASAYFFLIYQTNGKSPVTLVPKKIIRNSKWL